MKNILLTLLLFIFFSCKSTGDKTDCEVLHVDLVERPVPTEELFSKISVIPLETNDSSFLVRPVKVIIKDNGYYIVDEGVPAVFSFDEEGHLLHKIGKKGQETHRASLVPLRFCIVRAVRFCRELKLEIQF